MAELNLLQKKILADGIIKSGDVLKVDSLPEHQIDVPFISELGKIFKKLFASRPVTKILTIEASGIGIACLTAIHMGVPVVFAKKISGQQTWMPMYTARKSSPSPIIKSNHVIVSKKYLNGGDHILIIDDFLANGCAVEGLMDLVDQAGGTVEGVGICIEKGFQGGGDALRKKGVNLKSLAIIEKMDAKTGTIVFR